MFLYFKICFYNYDWNWSAEQLDVCWTKVRINLHSNITRATSISAITDGSRNARCLTQNRSSHAECWVDHYRQQSVGGYWQHIVTQTDSCRYICLRARWRSNSIWSICCRHIYTSKFAIKQIHNKLNRWRLSFIGVYQRRCQQERVRFSNVWSVRKLHVLVIV